MHFVQNAKEVLGLQQEVAMLSNKGGARTRRPIRTNCIMSFPPIFLMAQCHQKWNWKLWFFRLPEAEDFSSAFFRAYTAPKIEKKFLKTVKITANCLIFMLICGILYIIWVSLCRLLQSGLLHNSQESYSPEKSYTNLHICSVYYELYINCLRKSLRGCSNTLYIGAEAADLTCTGFWERFRDSFPCEASAGLTGLFRAISELPEKLSQKKAVSQSFDYINYTEENYGRKQ